jgi:hypothetical protein
MTCGDHVTTWHGGQDTRKQLINEPPHPWEELAVIGSCTSNTFRERPRCGIHHSFFREEQRQLTRRRFETQGLTRVPASHSRGPGFKSRPRNRPPWLSFFLVFLIPSRQMLVWYSPQITCWSPQGMRVLRQCTIPRAVVIFVTIQRENIRPSKKEMNKAVTTVTNCPMFSIRLRITTSPYRLPTRSLPCTGMLCTPPSLH